MNRIMISAIVLQIALAMLGGLAGAQTPDLQPTQYASRSGEFLLTVNPTERDGSGEGEYTLSSGKEPIWRSRLPFTFREAAIGDDGSVIGYAYSRGLPDWRAEGELIIAIISVRGEMVLRRNMPRRYGEIVEFHSPPYPIAHGVLIDSLMNRGVVRVQEDQESEELLFVFELDSGALLGRKGCGTSRIERASLLPSLPLALIWRWSGRWMEGAQFLIYNYESKRDSGEADQIWILERAQDYRNFSTLPWENDAKSHLHASGPILSIGLAGEFSLWLESEGARANYKAYETGGGWAVREESRSTYVPPTHSSAPPDLPELTLVALESVSLGSPGSDQVPLGQSPEDREMDRRIATGPHLPELVQPGGMEIDSNGRIFVQDLKSGCVHAFAESGENLFVCVPEPDDPPTPLCAAAITVRHDGHVFVETRCSKSYTSFDNSGMRGRKRYTRAPIRFFPNSPGAWTADENFRGIALLDEALNCTRVIERCADGNWTPSHPRDFFVFPDGGLAVSSLNGIATFGRDGTPITVEALPSGLRYFDGPINEDWAIMSRDANDLILLDRRRQIAYRGHTGLEFGETARSYVALTPNQKQLWIVVGTTPPVLHKFKLPASKH